MIYSHDSTDLGQYNTVIHCIIIMSLLFIFLRKKYLIIKRKNHTHNKYELKHTHNKYELKRTIKKNHKYINYHYFLLFLVVYN